MKAAQIEVENGTVNISYISSQCQQERKEEICLERVNSIK